MLRPDRHIITTEITLSCFQVVEAGQILVYGVPGSGAAMGDTVGSGVNPIADANSNGVGSGYYSLPEGAGTCQLVVNPSGYTPVGLALTNMVSIDQTKQHRNFMKTDQVIGEKMALLRHGWVVTSKVSGTPAPGNPAYLGTSGVAQPTSANAVANPKLGEFMTQLDQDGFCKLFVELPA